MGPEPTGSDTAENLVAAVAFSMPGIMISCEAAGLPGNPIPAGYQ